MKIVHFITEYKGSFVCRYYDINEITQERKLCKEIFNTYQLALDFIWLLEKDNVTPFVKGSKPFKKSFPGDK